MNIVGKVVVTGAKVVGTAVVGGTGIILSMMEDKIASGSGTKCGNDASEACFNLVKKMWGEEEAPSTEESVDKLKDGIESLNDAMDLWTVKLNKEKELEMQEALNNPSKMKILLMKAGKDPKLADNPNFMKAMRKKYASDSND